MRYQWVLLLCLALPSAAWSETGDTDVDAGVVDAGVVDAGAPMLAVKPAPVVSAPKTEPVAPPVPESKPLDLSFLEVLLPVSPAISSLYYDFSAVYARVAPGFAEAPFLMTGLRFVERNSGLGKMLMYVATQLFMALGEGVAASQGQHVGTTYHPGYRIDYYRPYSSQELGNMRAAREQAGDDLLQSNMSLDLQLYLPVQGLSTASGISAEITPITIEFVRNFGLEIAFQYAKLTDVQAGDPTKLRSFEYVGTPIRLMAGWQFLQFQLQWSPNFIGGFGVSPKVMDQKYTDSVAAGGNLLYTNSPWSFTVSLHPLRWVFVRATGSWTKYEFNPNALGFMLEGGLRF